MNAYDSKMSSGLPRPRAASLAWIEALAATAAIEEHPERLLSHILHQQADTSPDAPALLSDLESFTFAELSDRIRAYAQWARAAGLKRGHRVALLMRNRPEYVACWLGLSSIGVITALININLAGRSLAHCLEIAAPAHVIVEAQLAEPFTACSPHWLATTPKLWSHGADIPGCDRIDTQLSDAAESGWVAERVTLSDTALLIYTSGTTGLPKAARVSHRRVLNWALWFKGLMGNTPADRMYDCLPLYHSVGGIVAVAATLAAGGSTVIAEKFSSRRFWDDIRRWNCTQFQYIGELCRYLLNAPPQEADGLHGLRAACGNGLRADVWLPFKERFAIPQIVEFYAATEGNFSLFNVEGRPGSIGRIPPYLRHRFPTAIVKHDSESGMPLRNADGFCIPAETGEAGEALGRIGDGSEGSGRFEGYTDVRETERKILRNVFEPGDAWFRTGDLMRSDAAGHFCFVDRIGDTFRWKGENVSTLEVANVLAQAPGVSDAVVYGVAVPGADGKAGMAFLEVQDGFNPDTFLKHAEAQLPAYALPLFLRIGRQVAVTETFKHRKQDLVRDGFDPSASGDMVYARLPGARHFALLDAELFERINAGAFRF